jgi:hypothetical protein
MSRASRRPGEHARRRRSLISGAFTLLLQLWPLTPAYANDCVAYLKNPTGQIPRGTLEDCARTPGAQALFTALAGTAGGVLIATALGQAMRQAAQQGTRGGGTRILSGAEALQWLHDKGFMENGLPTQKFNRWQRRPLSDETPDKDGLGAVGGEWDWGDGWGPTDLKKDRKGQYIDTGTWDPDKQKWVKEPEITIVVDDGDEPPLPEKESPPEKEPPPKEPPEKQRMPGKESPPEKEPPPKRPPFDVEERYGDPCHDKQSNWETKQTEVKSLLVEFDHIDQQITAVERAWSNKGITLGLCATLDIGTTSIGVLLIPVMGFWGGPGPAVALAAVSEVIKTAIRNTFDKDPDGYVANVGKGEGQVAISEAASAAAKWLRVNGNASERVAEAFGKGVGGILGTAMSVGTAAQDIAKLQQERAVLMGQRDNLKDLRFKTWSFIQTAAQEREAARLAVTDCRQRWQEYLDAMRARPV